MNKIFTNFGKLTFFILAGVGALMLLGILYLAFLWPIVTINNLKHESSSFPYPPNTHISESSSIKGSYCFDVCPTLHTYSVFSSDTPNVKAFTDLVASLKSHGYKFENDPAAPYYSLAAWNITTPSGKHIDLQVWPEPPLTPGLGNGNEPNPAPESSTQWISVTFRP